MDSTLKIKLPIFSIHGNHDGPVGLDLIGAMDQISVNSYVNYFGKVPQIEVHHVEPIIFVKGETKIALYGIGHIPDTRFNILLERKLIEWGRPCFDDGQIDESFYNILVIHQNRFKGTNNWSTRNSVADESLPEWFDLVIWGHEHECMGTRMLQDSGTVILQPGSTVITSFVQGEQAKKKAWVVSVSTD